MYKHVIAPSHAPEHVYNNHYLMSFAQIDMILVPIFSDFYILSPYALII
jgi:hypothetical protein